jgi:mannose-1-phosphate guanylyltransferase
VDAIILAGGLGSRMRPLTRTTPKPMLPVGGVALAAQLVHRAQAAGVSRVVLATSYRAEAFAALAEQVDDDGPELRFTTEQSPLGTGGALRLASDALDGHADEPVLVLNGDLLSAHDITAQLDALVQATPRADVCLHGRTVPDARPYGCIVADPDGRVRAFLEKSPEPPSQLVNAGTYAVRRSVLAAIPAGRVLSFEREILPDLVAEGLVVVHPEEAYFCDVGTPEALAQASCDVVLGRVPGARVEASGTCPDGSWVHPEAQVDPSARIRESLVLAGARVGPEARVRRCVLAPGSTVGARADLERVTLGDRASVPPGAALPPGAHLDVDERWSSAEA